MANFRRVMIAACVLGGSVFGYAAAIRMIIADRPGLPDRHRALPCGEWIRSVVAGVDARRLTDSFTGKISEQVDSLKTRDCSGPRWTWHWTCI